MFEKESTRMNEGRSAKNYVPEIHLHSSGELSLALNLVEKNRYIPGKTLVLRSEIIFFLHSFHLFYLFFSRFLKQIFLLFNFLVFFVLFWLKELCVCKRTCNFRCYFPFPRSFTYLFWDIF